VGEIPVLKSLLEITGMNAEIHTFSGDHRVEEEVLKNWVKLMNAR